MHYSIIIILVILDDNDNCIRNILHRILITTGNQNHAHEEYPIQFLSLHYAGIILRKIGYKFGGITGCLQVK